MNLFHDLLCVEKHISFMIRQMRSQEDAMEPTLRHWMHGQIVSMPFMEGQRFVVVESFAGGMREVYHLRTVARPRIDFGLKLLQAHIDDAVFVRECRLWLSAAGFPFVARPFTYGTVDGRRCIVMQWYERSLEASQGESWSWILRRCSEITVALEYCYEQAQIVHQDIKPANVLIDRYGIAHLSDFGLARTIKRNRNTSLTDGSGWSRQTLMGEAQTSGEIGGTPFFMAPELFAGDREASQITDIYSLGVLMFTMLTGEHPHISAGQVHSAPRLHRLREQATKAGIQEVAQLMEIIGAMVAMDPRKRPESYQDILRVVGRPPPINSGSNQHPSGSAALVRASFHRQEGDPEKAERIIAAASGSDIRDEAVINAQLVSRLRSGDQAGALSFGLFETEKMLATREPERVLRGIDLVLNTTNIMRKAQAFDAAADVLRRCVALASLELSFRLYQAQVAELGWYQFYNGDFETSRLTLVHCHRSGKLDQLHQWVFVQVSWLTKTITGSNADLWEVAQRLRDQTIGCVILGGVVAAIMGKSRALSYRQGIPSEVITEIERQSQNSGMQLLLPEAHSTRVTIIHDIDLITTGGRYHGHL
jgi:serine/threonine protein kinase